MQDDRNITVIKPSRPSRLRRFLTDTNGAVTVDWVVLTAGIVGLAASIQMFINPVIVGEHGGSVNAAMVTHVATGTNGTMLGD